MNDEEPDDVMRMLFSGLEPTEKDVERLHTRLRETTRARRRGLTHEWLDLLRETPLQSGALLVAAAVLSAFLHFGNTGASVGAGASAVARLFREEVYGAVVPPVDGRMVSRVERWQRYDEAARVEEVVHPLPEGLGHLDGTRIVQVSDLHVGRYMRVDHWGAHVARLNALRPDLVVITGDAMDWARRYEDDYVAPLAGLSPRIATLAILGNHDFYFGAERLARVYRDASDVILLRGDTFRTDALPGLVVWGMDDPMTPLALSARYPRLNRWASSALDPSEYNVLLSHRPDAFRHAPRLGFDLQLSGHTHGGQIVMTAPWGARFHIASFLGRWDQGEFDAPRDDRVSRLYVNRGLGFAGVPYRRDCPSEITIHTLVDARTQAHAA